MVGGCPRRAPRPRGDAGPPARRAGRAAGRAGVGAGVRPVRRRAVRRSAARPGRRPDRPARRALPPRAQGGQADPVRRRGLYPAYGSAAAELATRVAAVQDALGEHQDSVIARELLRTLAVHANAANENAYTYGLLAGRELCAAHTSLTEFTSVWRGASRRRYRRRLADR